ncbi:NAD(P)-binding protein [Dendrothele bispora CBS 962.96]|uniref:NAD(P)-binding protein n=1 Tax=Dendrothele bispora (strain CBS 962.96) TaxID=1314807 RepID=A0A4S8LEF4_DENBC|nr:NAD(P)-binding protein [Dendrothele bispora CBS 962.96]
MAPAVWFITGSSSGMGRAMTERVLSQGNIAVATLRRPEVLNELKTKYSQEHLLVLRLDISQPEEISAAFQRTKEVYGRIDFVFSNAGYSMLGEIESTPQDMAQKMFDTNFWGSMNVARESVRFFREVNNPQGGHFIQISSIVGIVASAALGYYTASKHALEGALESMSKELDPKWNIKISIVEPGGFATRGAQPESLVQTPPHPAYDYEGSHVKFMRGYIPGTNQSSLSTVAMKALYDTLGKIDKAPLRVPLGKDAIKGFRTTAKSLEEDASKFESLSDDLLMDGKAIMTHLDH